MPQEDDCEYTGVRDTLQPVPRSRLRWSASGQGWFATTADGREIFIAETTYQRHLQAYLKGRGMQNKSWAEVMSPAEAEWRQYCEATAAFQADLETWLDVQEPGIVITPRPTREDL